MTKVAPGSGAAVRFLGPVVAVALVLAACSDDTGAAGPAAEERVGSTTSEGGSSTTSEAAATTTAAPTTTTLAAATSRTLAVTMESPSDLVGYNLYRPVDLDAVGMALPVVVWGNGGCVRHDATWRPLYDRWAAAGFLVVTIAAPETAVEGQPGATDPHSADDQAAGIDWAFEQNDLAGGPYEGRIDTGRVVAAGNSCGGITALRLAAGDQRVRSVFVLSGSSVPPGSSSEQAAAVMGDVSAPVGWVVGGREDLASAMAEQDYEVLGEGVAGFVAGRSDGDHVMVSTEPEILAQVAEIGLNWMDLTLYGSDVASEAIGGIPCSGCEPGLWTMTSKNLDSLPVGGP